MDEGRKDFHRETSLIIYAVIGSIIRPSFVGENFDLTMLSPAYGRVHDDSEVSSHGCLEGCYSEPKVPIRLSKTSTSSEIRDEGVYID